jgi:hypothetical protein
MNGPILFIQKVKGALAHQKPRYFLTKRYKVLNEINAKAWP